MAEKDGPECVKCKSTSSLMWQRNQSGATLCLDCHTQEKKTRLSKSPQRSGSSTSETSVNSSSSSSTNHANQAQYEKSSAKQTTTTVSTRRTTRARERNSKAKQQQQSQAASAPPPTSTPPSPATNNINGVNGTNAKSLAVEKTNCKSTNGSHGERDNGGEDYYQKSRRSLQLKQGPPMKAPGPETIIVTSDSIIHQGTTYEVGDVVSLLDRDGGIYYAVIRGFMQDQYAEKYAVLTWLLPRYPNPTHFDPAAFILGPEEDEPRSMDVVEFVSHSPQSRHFQTSYFHNLEQAELWNH